MKIDDLQNNYLELIERHRKGNLFSSDPQRIPPRDAAEFPAFFFAENIPVMSGGILPLKDTDAAVPFDCFWIVYRTANGAWGYNENALLYDGRNDQSQIYAMFKTMDDRVLKQWVCGDSFNLGDDYDAAPRTVKEYLPEFFLCLTMLNRDQEQDEPAALRSVNAGRMKSKNGLKAIPPFITVRNDRPAPAGERSQAGTGSSRSPHDRRGHIRRLASGRIIHVRPSRIHGGSSAPRSYIVE